MAPFTYMILAGLFIIQSPVELPAQPVMVGDKTRYTERSIPTDEGSKAFPISEEQSPTPPVVGNEKPKEEGSPPTLDPEIVHEPPIPPNPEAIIKPPRLDQEMVVNPDTLPRHPEFPQKLHEGREPNTSHLNE